MKHSTVPFGTPPFRVPFVPFSEQNDPTETGQWNTPKIPEISLKTLVPDRGCQNFKPEIFSRVFACPEQN